MRFLFFFALAALLGCSSSSHTANDAGVDGPPRDFGRDAMDPADVGPYDAGTVCSPFMDCLTADGCFGHGRCTGHGGEWICVCADGGPVDAGPTDAGSVDAGSIDAGVDLGAPPFDGGGELAVSIGSTMLQSCDCHHGCGAGIDGTFGIDVVNAGAASHVLRITSITFTPFGMPGGPWVVPRDGYLTIGGAMVDTASVAAGTMSSLAIGVYLDFTPPFAAMPGTYRIDVLLEVDGVAAALTLAAASVAAGITCL